MFIHLRYWPTDDDAVIIRDRLVAGETVKIVYDTPWFWKCSASRLPKPQRDKPRSTPYVEFETPKKEQLVTYQREASPSPIRRKASVKNTVVEKVDTPTED